MMSATMEKSIFSGSMWKYSEADEPCKPFGQHIQVQRLVRRKQRFPVLSGNRRERVNVLALTATFGDHCIGDGLADHAIGNQQAQKLRQGQFVFMRAHLLHVRLPERLFGLYRYRVAPSMAML